MEIDLHIARTQFPYILCDHRRGILVVSGELTHPLSSTRDAMKTIIDNLGINRPSGDYGIPQKDSGSSCSSQSVIVRILGSLLLVLLLSIGCSDAPTEATDPSAATEAPGGLGDSGQEVAAAVQQLFETWNRALVSRDAELFRSVLARELAGVCGLDELQSWFDQGEDVLAQVIVRSVFVDVADPSRAFAEITTMEDAGRSEESPTFPWPVVLEDGKWRVEFHYALTVERCPYTASTESSEPGNGEREFPQIPGLDLERREEILAAVPGTRVVLGSFRTDNFSSSFSSASPRAAYGQQVIIYAELETDSEGAELLRLYRDGLKHPSWDIVDEGSSGDYGWFSWTVLDVDGLLWHGKLVIAPSHEGWSHVWLSLNSNDP